MNKIEILSIFDNILGSSIKTGEDNYAYFCPFCKHYKRKLEINIETFNYHCWTCTPKLGGKNFYFLFRKMENVNETNINIIKEYTNTPSYKKETFVNANKIRLPFEFKSMSEEWSSIEFRHAKAYLKKRNISDLDIEKYNIGYCESGEYADRIIVPSYDSNGSLNYFIGRSFFGENLKYKNPKVSKNVVLFENLISWNNPILLCEGMFDAIALKRNAIPLLGKTLPLELKNKINLHNVNDIYICLDSDARKDAIHIAEELMATNDSRNVYLLRLDEKDPSEIGFNKMIELIKNAEKFDFKNLIFSRLFE